MIRDILQRAIQRLAQTAEEHEVEHIVHLTSKHRPDRSRQVAEALEDWSFCWRVLLPATSAHHFMAFQVPLTLFAADDP
jgi:hypothetical protein